MAGHTPRKTAHREPPNSSQTYLDQWMLSATIKLENASRHDGTTNPTVAASEETVLTTMLLKVRNSLFTSTTLESSLVKADVERPTALVSKQVDPP